MKLDTNWPSKVCSMRFADRALLFGGVMLICFLLVVPVSYLIAGGPGMVTSAAAMAICLVAGLLALLVGEAVRGSEFLLAGFLAGIGIRLGIPLALFIVIYLRGGMLAEAGFVYYLMIFYPIMLVVETLLSLPEINTAAD